MIPIEKNILVVDQQGNEYEATWPKRARGLVKNGRARFLSENKICLACPPNTNLEDNEMTDIEAKKTVIEMGQNHGAPGNTEAGSDAAETIDVAYILRQIKAIQDETAYLHGVIEGLNKMSDGDSGGAGAPGNILGQSKAQALGDVVRCKENTNQQLLSFYINVYNDMTSQK